MTLPFRPDPASFRDPTAIVVVREDEVLRCLSAEALVDFEALSSTRFYSEAIEDGRLVKTVWAPDPIEQFLDRFAGFIRHDRIPFISYPYEWSFQMLKKAALLTLNLLQASLDEGMTMKDATPYNVQFIGTHPTFIDLGSFEKQREGEPWYGYLQFCQMFLYPLMLQAYAGIAFQPWLRSCLGGVTPDQQAKLLSGRRRFRRGVFKHVFLHSRFQSAFSANARTMDVQEDLKGAGFRKDLVKSNVRGLIRLVESLDWKPEPSEWSDYRSMTGYEKNDISAKEEFVEGAVAAAATKRLVWDLGANDGRYSIIAGRSADVVLAIDSDHAVVDRLFRQLSAEGDRRILPLVIDIANPSPGTGWGGRERPSFMARGRPDLILMLAVVHHLALSGNLPLPEIVRWLAEQGAELVIEFPTPDDPQVKKLIRNKREGIHASYHAGAFEAALGEHFEVFQRKALPSGTRLLYHARPWAAR